MEGAGSSGVQTKKLREWTKRTGIHHEASRSATYIAVEASTAEIASASSNRWFCHSFIVIFDTSFAYPSGVLTAREGHLGCQQNTIFAHAQIREEVLAVQDSDGKSCVDRMHRIKMHKEVTVKEDGRLLVYYTFGSTAAETSAADKGNGKTDKETSL